MAKSFWLRQVFAVLSVCCAAARSTAAAGARLVAVGCRHERRRLGSAARARLGSAASGSARRSLRRIAPDSLRPSQLPRCARAEHAQLSATAAPAHKPFVALVEQHTAWLDAQRRVARLADLLSTLKDLLYQDAALAAHLWQELFPQVGAPARRLSRRLCADRRPRLLPQLWALLPLPARQQVRRPPLTRRARRSPSLRSAA